MGDWRDGQDHFDGIIEEDNPMPDWWLATFLGAVIFAFIYVMHYHLSADNSLSAEYLAEKERVEALAGSKAGGVSDFLKQFPDKAGDEQIASGKVVFDARCSVCHGAMGEGKIGPNLTDSHWIHGTGDIGTISKVVIEGVLDKGMPAWGTILAQNELTDLMTYVRSILNTQKVGKGPEGAASDLKR